jgi:hypothetical protein
MDSIDGEFLWSIGMLVCFLVGLVTGAVIVLVV